MPKNFKRQNSTHFYNLIRNLILRNYKIEIFGVNSPNLKRNATIDILDHLGNNLKKKIHRHQTIDDVKL